MFKNIANYITKQSKWFWATILITLIVDAVNSVYLEKTQAFFYVILEGKDKTALFSMFGIYSLFIVLLVFIGVMSSYGERAYRDRKNKKRFKKLLNILLGL